MFVKITKYGLTVNNSELLTKGGSPYTGRTVEVALLNLDGSEIERMIRPRDFVDKTLPVGTILDVLPVVCVSNVQPPKDVAAIRVYDLAGNRLYEYWRYRVVPSVEDIPAFSAENGAKGGGYWSKHLNGESR